MIKTFCRWAAVPFILILAGSGGGSALAGPDHDDPHWYAGLGFGPARAAFRVVDETGEGTETWWRTGSTPQLRFGRYLGPRFALGLEVQAWFYEFGTAGDDLPLQLKLRVTGQLWAVAGTWQMGAPGSPLEHFYLRAGAGPAITTFATAIPSPEEPESGQELQARIDEWGWGVSGGIGYERRVGQHFAAGLFLGSTHLFIGEDIDRAWYGGPALQLRWLF